MVDNNRIGKECTFLTFMDECATLMDLIMLREPIYQMQMMPYLALFCESFTEYFNIEMDEELKMAIKQIRHKIGAFKDKHSKSKKKVLEEDKWQDDVYSEGLLSFIKSHNMYYNFGIFCTQDKRIIGNTQLTDIELNMVGLPEEEKHQKSYNMGYVFGSYISIVYNEALKHGQFNSAVDLEKKKELQFMDINTNDNEIFNDELSKEDNLLLIHVLSRICFIKYYVEPLFVKDDTWLLRVIYISMHNAFLTIMKMCKIVNNAYTDNLLQIINNNEKLINSEYRNCMMHYSFFKDGEFIISEEFLDLKKPFFGLIDQCFGKTWKEYYKELSLFRDQLETAITNILNFDKIELEEFDSE